MPTLISKTRLPGFAFRGLFLHDHSRGYDPVWDQLPVSYPWSDVPLNVEIRGAGVAGAMLCNLLLLIKVQAEPLAFGLMGHQRRSGDPRCFLDRPTMCILGQGVALLTSNHTPNLQAQGEQRLPSIFNSRRDSVSVFHAKGRTPTPARRYSGIRQQPGPQNTNSSPFPRLSFLTYGVPAKTSERVSTTRFTSCLVMPR